MAYNQSGQWGSSRAVSSTAEGIQAATKFDSSGFGSGFTVGYTTVMAVASPILAYKGAKYEKAKLKMQANIYRMAAKSSSTAADDTMRAGEQQAAAIGYQAGQAKSSSRASMAAAGVQVGASGNSAEALASIDIVKEIQVNQTMANAVAQSWGYRKQAVSSLNQAYAQESAASDINPWVSALIQMNTDAINFMSNQKAPTGPAGSVSEDAQSKDSEGKKSAPGGLNASWQDFAEFRSFFKGGSSVGSGAK